MIKRFFKTEKAINILEDLRGKFAIIEIEKSNGEERTLAGQIGYSNSQASYLLNEEEDSKLPPNFKRINPMKIISFNINGKTIRPLTPTKIYKKAMEPHPQVVISMEYKNETQRENNTILSEIPT